MAATVRETAVRTLGRRRRSLEIQPQAPEMISFRTTTPAASVVISWTGTESVSRKQAWPDCHPLKEMRERDPKLPERRRAVCATR